MPKRNEKARIKRTYEKPLIRKEKRMVFPFEIIDSMGFQMSCRQCSGCHGCR